MEAADPWYSDEFRDRDLSVVSQCNYCDTSQKCHSPTGGVLERQHIFGLSLSKTINIRGVVHVVIEDALKQ